jgi:hypothetical protein
MSRVVNEMHNRAKVQKHGVLEFVPGGELMYLAGPVADLRYQAARATIALHRGQDHVSDEHDTDGEHPALTLAWWEDKWRAIRSHDTDDTLVLGDVTYLDEALTWAGDNEPHFPEFAKGLRQQVTRVEDALLEGERDQVGARCLQVRRAPDQQVRGHRVEGSLALPTVQAQLVACAVHAERGRRAPQPCDEADCRRHRAALRR